jgi:hypothetical protein
MSVETQRIQGFVNEAFARDQPQANGQDLTWDDILTMDILTAIGTATQSMLQAAGQMASDVSTDMERVKAAFSCQAPENATLSAERIAVEHAFTEIQSVFSCGAPDKSQLDSDEVTCDVDASLTEFAADHVEAPAATEKHEQSAADLLDLSDQPVVMQNDAVPVHTNDSDLKATADSSSTHLEDLLELSDHGLAREKPEPSSAQVAQDDLLNFPDQHQRPEEGEASVVGAHGRREPLVTEAQPNNRSIEPVDLFDFANPNPASVEVQPSSKKIVDLLDLS